MSKFLKKISYYLNEDKNLKRELQSAINADQEDDDEMDDDERDYNEDDMDNEEMDMEDEPEPEPEPDPEPEIKTLTSQSEVNYIKELYKILSYAQFLSDSPEMRIKVSDSIDKITTDNAAQYRDQYFNIVKQYGIDALDEYSVNVNI